MLTLLALLGTGCPGSAGVDPCANVTCAAGRVCVGGRCEQLGLFGDGLLGWWDSSILGPASPDGGAAPAAPGTEGGPPPKLDGSSQPSADSQPPAPDMGPFCNNNKCDPGENCVSCPDDCGQCICQPGQVEKSSAGCAPCQQNQRTCLADGTWGGWTSCQYYCTGTYYCVNNQCAPCYPGTTETKSCACGTQTRTCDSSGNWAAWGSCNTTCYSGFSCSSNRCIDTYTAYSSGGGPQCGYVYSGSYKTYQYCQPGDYCLSSSARSCRKYQTTQVGDIYHAYQNAGGPQCGYFYSGSYKTYVYCKGGDTCKSSSGMQCAFAGTACGAAYTAYKNAGGPQCGYYYSGSYKTYVYCKGGDYCNSSSGMQCKVVTTCPAGSVYTAYPNAGGPQCGYYYSGSYKTYVYCKPTDLCKSSSGLQCQK